MNLPVIDLRSDSVTRPTPAMREVMARAQLGDDVFGDDPSVNALEAHAAAILGKEAALFVPSGTMANQIALLVHCRHGDGVIVGEGAHQMTFESGGGAAIAGVQFTVVGQGGMFGAEAVESAIQTDEMPCPPTRLISIENTHNLSGGRVWQVDALREISTLARRRGISMHLDGARLFNAEVATGIRAAELAALFDTISICLSKGLGAPVGSLLVGTRPTITRARRARSMLGGGMRQIGMLAAAGHYALDHHVARLAEDHEHARQFAAALGRVSGISVIPPETNMVIFTVEPDCVVTAQQLVEHAQTRGVALLALGRRVRAVMHLDVDADACLRATNVIVDILHGGTQCRPTLN